MDLWPKYCASHSTHPSLQGFHSSMKCQQNGHPHLTYCFASFKSCTSPFFNSFSISTIHLERHFSFQSLMISVQTSLVICSSLTSFGSMKQYTADFCITSHDFQLPSHLFMITRRNPSKVQGDYTPKLTFKYLLYLIPKKWTPTFHCAEAELETLFEAISVPCNVNSWISAWNRFYKIF